MFDFQPRLSGDLIAMRPYQAADYQALFAAASDPLIWAMHPMQDRWREPVFKDYIEDAFTDRGGLVAIDRASGDIIGYSRYSERFAAPGEIEIGWTFLARGYWGGPYNSDMKRLMLTHAFRHYDRVIFRVGEINLRSRRALEKIGGVLTDRRQMAAHGGREVIHVVYMIERTAFAGI